MPAPTPGVVDEEGDAEGPGCQGPPPELVLDESLYAPRKKTSDSRSFYSGPRVVGRGFAIDWSRMNQEHFPAAHNPNPSPSARALALALALSASGSP